LIDLGNRLNALDSERSDDRVWLLRTIGSIFSHLERYHEAFPYLENARALWRTIGISEPAPYAALLNNCALSAQRSGRLQIAIERYNEALTVARSLDQAIHSKLLSNCLLNFGTLYHDLGMPEIAERYYKEVIDIDRRSPEVVALAQDILDYGNLLVNELGDPIQGTRYLEEALALLGKRPHNDEINAVLANLSDSLAGAYRVQGDIERAITTYQKALTIDVVRHNYRGFIQTTNNIGEMLLDKREGPAEAEACFQRSLSVITRHPDIDPDVVWRTYEGLARVAIRQGAPNEAQVAARRAADIVRSLVQPIDESQPRRLFGAGRSLPYYTLALLSARRGDAKMLVDAVESAKAVAFRESIAGSGPVASQNAVSERVEEWLGPRELALEYLFGEETDPVILLAVMHSGVFWAELQERRAIENRVRATLAKASSLGRISRESLSQLAGLLLPTKIIELLRLNVIQRIVVCPDGMLENVPFEGLAVPRGDGRSEFLINFATISVAPSLRWWAMWRTLPPRRWRRDVLVIAEPETATGQRDFGSLPGSQREADTVLSWGSHDSMRLSGSHANSDEFRSAESGEFKVLHFATHARTGGTLATSFLLFRSTPALDVLHGADILKLGLDGQLVILSACGTGEGRAVSGEGLDSLAHGFLTAGASYVMASRGPLKDDIPGPFMAALYQQLARGDTVDQALRMTKLHFLETGTSAGLESALAFEGIGFGDFTIPLTPIWTTQFFLLVRKYWIFGVGFMSLLLTVVVSLVVRKGQRSVKQAL
jgi:CHAT domain-containing protein/tetratricopeptide (TPR) repeat protein